MSAASGFSDADATDAGPGDKEVASSARSMHTSHRAKVREKRCCLPGSRTSGGVVRPSLPAQLVSMPSGATDASTSSSGCSASDPRTGKKKTSRPPGRRWRAASEMRADAKRRSTRPVVSSSAPRAHPLLLTLPSVTTSVATVAIVSAAVALIAADAIRSAHAAVTTAPRPNDG